jgi:tetratricopeptide (TPR) repeat protein
MGDRYAEAEALYNLGSAFCQLVKAAPAIELGEQALKIDRETANRSGEGRDFGLLAGAYRIKGETARATELYQQQLSVARELNDSRGEAMSLSSLATLHLQLKDGSRAVALLEEAGAVFSRVGDRRSLGHNTSDLGYAYYLSGDLARAAECYDRCVAFAREAGNHFGEAAMLVNKGTMLEELGEREEAVAAFADALVIFEKLDVPEATDVRAQLDEWRTTSSS